MSTEPKDVSAERFETTAGVTIAILAAILALSDLGGSKFGDDEILAHNDKNGAYLWYQSKGIKETQIEGQRATLDTLLAAGAIGADHEAAARQMMNVLDEKLIRYKLEKTEILLGSAHVDPDNWRQEVDGQMGKVVGAKEHEARAQRLGLAGDYFDYATLFLQLCLVLGAIAIVMKRARLKRGFYWAMVGLGSCGAVCATIAYGVAFRG